MKNLKAIIIGLILPFLMVGYAFSATYYMRADGTAANKAAATGAGSTQANCMNVTVHDSETFSAGDIIILCDDGGTYRDQIDVPSSGSGGSPITYQAESGDTPLISGADVVSTFTKTAISTTGNTSGTATSTDRVVLTSWTPVAGEIVLLGAATRHTGATINSVSGNNLTWTQVATVDNAQSQMQIFVWKGVGTAPTEGSITVICSHSRSAIVAQAVRLWGVSGSTPIEVSETDAGPGTDNANMKDDITTLTDGAWAMGFGTFRSGVFTAPGGEVQIGSTIIADPGTGDTTPMAIWYELVASAGATTVGADGDLDSARDWSQITLSVKPLETYDATLASTTYNVAENGTMLDRKSTLNGITAVGEWYYDSTGTKLYVRSSDDADPDTHTIEASVRQGGIKIFGQSYITVDGISFEMQQHGDGAPIGKDYGGGIWLRRGDSDPATYQGYIIQNCDFDKQGSSVIVVNNQSASATRQITNVSILDNTIGEFNWARRQGVNAIRVAGTAGGPAPTNVTITGNTIEQDLTLNPDDNDANEANGIFFFSGGGTNVIAENLISGVSHGIEVEGMDSSTAIGTVRYNFVYDTGDDGIWLKDNFASVTVHGNIFHNNNNDNIDTYKEDGGDTASNADIYNNVLSEATDYAFHLRRTSNVNFKNNIIITSDDGTDRIAIKLNDAATDTSLATLDSDHNIYYHALGGINIDIISTSLTATRTLAQWQSNETQDVNSVESDPLFTNPASDDFTLQAGSPARNAATNISGYEIKLHPGAVWPDNIQLTYDITTIGAYGYKRYRGSGRGGTSTRF